MRKNIDLLIKFRLSFDNYKDLEVIEIPCSNLSSLQEIIGEKHIQHLIEVNNAVAAELISIDLINPKDNTVLGMLNKHSSFFLFENFEELDYRTPNKIGFDEWEFDLHSLISYIKTQYSLFNSEQKDINYIQNLSYNILNNSLFRQFVTEIYDKDCSFEEKEKIYLGIVNDFIFD